MIKWLLKSVSGLAVTTALLTQTPHKTLGRLHMHIDIIAMPYWAALNQKSNTHP
jgi:hypothetical protein